MLSVKNTFEMLKLGRRSSGEGGTGKLLKMLRTKTALGVDVSAQRISLALLKRTKNGVELLASANAPLPEGVITDGSIVNTAALANAIKSLKNKSRIRTTRAAVSLFTKPAVVQIMGIPKQVPSNIGQFVQDQVKHVAVLPANNIALDFCGVAGAASEASYTSRLLVVAADKRKVDEIVKVCSQAGLTVEAIEPPLLSLTRALYAKKVAGKFDCNILIAILQACPEGDSTLTLCVFKKQAMDFIRTKTISRVPGEKTQLGDLSQWLAEQINAVIQFYDVEFPDSSGKWDITVVADGEIVEPLPMNAEGLLKAKVAGANLQILTSEDICQAAVIGQSRGPADYRLTDKPSPVALGLAMKLLDTDARNLGVNLLPPEVVRLRTAQKETLITANILAAVLLFMIFAVIVPEWKIKKLNKSISAKKVNLFKNARTLFGQRASVNKQIDAASNQINKINGILDSHPDTDWSGLLSDIGKAIPRTVCITNLSSRADSGVLLKGLATSNEAVYWFVDRLNKSERINLASIAETKRDNRGFITYEISCALAVGKGL
jgi:Tfp pilus assembly protein PilN